MASAAQQSLAIRRRMTWAWFVLGYSLFMVVTTSATMCFVTAILSFSDADVYDELNADDRLIRYCRARMPCTLSSSVIRRLTPTTDQLRVDCDQLDEKLRQEYAVAHATEEIPLWMVVAFYLMASQVLAATVYGLHASSGRLRDLRNELKTLQEYDKIDGEDAHMLSDRARSMDEPESERDAVSAKGGEREDVERGEDAPRRTGR